MKKWVNAQGSWFYIGGMALYLIGLVFLAQSFRYKNIAVASVIFVIFNIATLSLVSWFYFKETLSFLQVVGIGVGVLSIIILEVASK